MKLKLNTAFTPARVKHHYEIDGLVDVTAQFRQRSGDLAAVIIKGMTYNSASLYFNHLKYMVIEAKQKAAQEEEARLDDECLELIPQLRAM